MPFFLGLGVITLIISPAYPTYEYGKASFPEDPYGFTQAQRLDLALVAVDYLSRFAPAEDVIHLLEDQTIPGTDQPLYNDREIGHMVDVKKVSDRLRLIGFFAGLIVIGGLIFLWATPTHRLDGHLALRNGGLLTTGVLFIIALFILLAWSIFFVQFHELLFPPGSWTFSYSDSLIRLFPEKFWFDIGVIISVGTLFIGLDVAALGWYLLRRASPASAKEPTT